jgi:hypothetical protein
MELVGFVQRGYIPPFSLSYTPLLHPECINMILLSPFSQHSLSFLHALDLPSPLPVFAKDETGGYER